MPAGRARQSAIKAAIRYHGIVARTVAARGIVKPKTFFAAMPILMLLGLFAAGSHSAPVSHLTVRIATGSQTLVAGSDVELRIYTIGGRVLRLPLAHGDSWSRDSTRVIPLNLSEPLDARTVMRYSIYYRAATPESPPWEIASAQVELASGSAAPELLLDATVSGVIAKQGEVATIERSAGSLVCATDADCDDHRSCNGVERCRPRSVGADARGCVKGAPVACPVNQVCTEGRGCVGPDSLNKAQPKAPEAN